MNNETADVPSTKNLDILYLTLRTDRYPSKNQVSGENQVSDEKSGCSSGFSSMISHWEGLSGTFDLCLQVAVKPVSLSKMKLIEETNCSFKKTNFSPITYDRLTSVPYRPVRPPELLVKIGKNAWVASICVGVLFSKSPIVFNFLRWSILYKK